MPPSGKIPVSIAALRTTSTTSPMSTLASRLAEYSMVKCGMFRIPGYSDGLRQLRRTRFGQPVGIARRERELSGPVSANLHDAADMAHSSRPLMIRKSPCKDDQFAQTGRVDTEMIAISIYS